MSGKVAECGLCTHWSSVHYGAGECRKAGSVNAKFWIEGSDEPRLVTLSHFVCGQFEEKEPGKLLTL